MIRIVAALAAVAALAGVTQSQDLKHVRFVTDWKAEAEHGGFYQAKAKGFYAAHGLDVEIIQGGPSVNVPLLLGSGNADMGVGSNAFIPLNMVDAGVPAVAVAAMFQKDPQVLITHPRGDVTKLADMKGKPIMISDASVGAFWVWLKAKYGFDDSQIRKYTFNLAPFITDESAIQQGYVTSEPYQIEKEGGFKPQVYLLADEGYPGYANMIVATQALIDSDPETVRAFVAASAEGWKDFLSGDHAPGSKLVMADNPEMTQDVIDQAIATMNANKIVAADDGSIGVMTDARWKDFFDIMSANGVFKKDLDWKKAYRLDFLPK